VYFYTARWYKEVDDVIAIDQGVKSEREFYFFGGIFVAV